MPPPCSRADAARPTLMLTATRHRSTRTPQHVCTQHSTRKHTSQHGHTYHPTHSANMCTHKYAHVTTHSTDMCAHSTHTCHNTGTPTAHPHCQHVYTQVRPQHTAQTRVHTAHTHITTRAHLPPHPQCQHVYTQVRPHHNTQHRHVCTQHTHTTRVHLPPHPHCQHMYTNRGWAATEGISNDTGPYAALCWNIFPGKQGTLGRREPLRQLGPLTDGGEGQPQAD